jgi:peptidyl-prolyl cis-trans isomerase SurA
MKKLLFVLIGSISFAIASNAQPQKIVADKISAIVGDKIILYSDIENAKADIVRRGGTVPENADCAILEQALVSKVLMLQAMKDSLPVTDEDVEADLDMRVRMFINQYGSTEEVERIAGKTIYQIKDDARESVRENKLAEAMQKKIVDNINVTPTEVKTYFDRFPKDSLPFFESEVEVGQIAVFPKASRELEQFMIDELNHYKQEIEAKHITFEQAAKLYSEDPGTKDRGGLFEVDRNDKASIDPAFLAASFRLKDGEISAPIKSQFGYHLIQMVQRNGDLATVRHILRIPPVTDDEIKQGVSKLDSIRSKIIAGTMDFAAAAGKYSEDPNQKFTGAYIMSGDGDTYNRIDELDKDVVATLANLKLGEISQPVTFVNERGKKGVRILYLKTRTEPHRMNLRDDYNKIKQAALEEKKYQAIDKWLTTNIPNYYIMVDQDNAGCTQLQKWTNAQKTYASK